MTIYFLDTNTLWGYFVKLNIPIEKLKELKNKYL